MKTSDFLVIGAGVAGLSFALRAAEHGKVAVITKGKFLDCSSAKAQGGIAAVWDRNDSFEDHIADTLDAGAGLCNEQAVRTIVEEGPGAIRELLEWGVNFDPGNQGEDSTERNPVANHKSSWDSAWRENFGGFDNPDPVCRTVDFRPKTFVPRQNPFYVALPYNDVCKGEHKTEASRVIPWFRREYTGKGQSVCKGRWVQIVYNKRSCFAQWEDCGPFTTEDWPYVFGDKPPVNTQNKGAGIDISPAVRDYLGITGGTAVVHWRFVEFYRIPRGPWSKWGDNNPFVNSEVGPGRKALQSREDRLRQQQEAIQRELLKDPQKLRRELQG